MSPFHLVLALVCSLLYVSCQPNSTETDAFQSTPVNGKISNADLIRNPIQADGLRDTLNVAKMSFDTTDYYFGSVTEGSLIEKTFRFTNTGLVPLLISDARSTCGCTVADWPKQPIPAGEEAHIKARFDTTNKTGKQAKTISITANTYPAITTLRLIGEVSSSE